MCVSRRREKCDSGKCFEDANLRALVLQSTYHIHYLQLIFTQLSAKEVSIIPTLQIIKLRVGYLKLLAQGHNIVNGEVRNKKALKF